LWGKNRREGTTRTDQLKLLRAKGSLRQTATSGEKFGLPPSKSSREVVLLGTAENKPDFSFFGFVGPGNINEP